MSASSAQLAISTLERSAGETGPVYAGPGPFSQPERGGPRGRLLEIVSSIEGKFQTGVGRRRLSVVGEVKDLEIHGAKGVGFFFRHQILEIDSG